MMGASYWARWACAGRVDDLPNRLLPQVLEEGYDLLSCEADKQVFDCGGVMKKIAWSLNGGRWSDAPLDLTITYAHSYNKTVANFYWRLSVRPFPTTQKEQASYELWIRGQLDRIVAALPEQVDEVISGATDEMAILSTHVRHQGNGLPLPGQQMIGVDLAIQPSRARPSIQYASTYVEEPPRCDRCWKSAVAIPGTTGRYYCLTCRRHLPRRSAATP